MPDITKGETFESGDLVTANKLNNLLDSATINSLSVNAAKLAADAVTNAKVSSTAAIDWSKMASLDSGKILVGNSDNQAAEVAMSGDGTIDNAGVLTVSQQVPTGAVVMWYTGSPPTGWLFCNGGTFDAATYPALDALLGGNTLPDFKGRVPVGVGQQSNVKWSGSDYTTSGTNFALAGTGGTEDHHITESEMPSHDHTFTLQQGTTTYAGPRTLGDAGSVTNTFTTATAGSDGAHNNTQPYLVVNYIIKT